MLQYLSDGRIFTFCNWSLTTIIKVLRAVAAIFRINVALILPIHFFYPTDVLQSESGPLPHHTSPPAAKSVLPINTRPALNCNSGPLFHNSFYSIVLPMIKYNPRNTFWIYTWKSSISFSSPGKHKALEENGKLWFRWFTSLWLSATTGRGPSGNLSSRTNQS